MASLSPNFNTQFFTNAGVPAASYLLRTYDSGTTTPKATFTDQAGTVPNANPIVLDEDGRCTLWLGTGEYRLRLETPAGALVKQWDDVAGIPAASDSEFVPLVGGVTMTGRFNLAGAAVSALQPTTYTQMTDAIAAAVADLATDVELAAVAADVTAAEGNITTLQADALTLKGVPANTTSGGVDGEATNVSSSFSLDVSGWTAGRVRAWQNTTSSSLTITSSGGTLRLNGTTSTGNRVLLPYGFATVRCYSAGVAVISGAVS